MPIDKSVWIMRFAIRDANAHTPTDDNDPYKSPRRPRRSIRRATSTPRKRRTLSQRDCRRHRAPALADYTG